MRDSFKEKKYEAPLTSNIYIKSTFSYQSVGKINMFYQEWATLLLESHSPACFPTICPTYCWLPVFSQSDAECSAELVGQQARVWLSGPSVGKPCKWCISCFPDLSAKYVITKPQCAVWTELEGTMISNSRMDLITFTIVLIIFHQTVDTTFQGKHLPFIYDIIIYINWLDCYLYKRKITHLQHFGNTLVM